MIVLYKLFNLLNEPDGSATLTTSLRVSLLTANTMDEFEQLVKAALV